MTQRSSLKRSHHHLRHLVESVVAQDFELNGRGLAFFVDEVDVVAAPPERLRLWATLHFLPLGSPFCCMEPLCHVPLFGEYMDRANDALRRRMRLRQTVSMEFVSIGAVLHTGSEFDDPIGGTLIPHPGDIDQRDRLGRTALMRAAVRGYDRQVEELLAAGADPTIVDYRGRGILELCSKRQGWIPTMLEGALGLSTSLP